VHCPAARQTENADRVRRALPVGQTQDHASPSPPPSGIAPKLRALMADYAATGLPPAYVPKDESPPATPLTDLDIEQEEDPS
jgi:putative transposase